MTSPSGEQFVIRAGRHVATIVEVSGGVREYREGERDLRDPYSLDAVCDGANIHVGRRTSDVQMLRPHGYRRETPTRATLLERVGVIRPRPPHIRGAARGQRPVGYCP